MNTAGPATSASRSQRLLTAGAVASPAIIASSHIAASSAPP